ncbi:MAG: sodium:proton antiporter [Blautia sp.]|nr:sodium:proton antiporter [Lachnoclostridium sp.]MCM1211974.1 sodium:proton antiporter [Blautia sp.]
MKESITLAILVFYPLAGALISAWIGSKKEKTRDYFADFIVVSEFVLALALAIINRGKGGGEICQYAIPGICGMGLHFTMDGFRLVYSVIAAWMWMMTTILSREYMSHHQNKNRYYLFLLATLGATMGVFLSADLFTTFIFFEIMSFTSYVWVAQEETESSLKAAATYLAVAIIGGLTMLMGVFLLYHTLGTVQIQELFFAAQCYEGDKSVLYGAAVCLLVGFGAKAGAFPLHIWLPKAHPVAPAPASALLSGILTKTGVFGILIISCDLFLDSPAWGSLILSIGVLTMFGGALLAVFSIDLKRTLACSSMSQIGFILVGVGMQGLLGEEKALAMHGTFLHMINHSLIKLVLFMAAGVIFMNAHALDLNEIRGYGRKKPLLKGIFLIGALSIGGIPFFSGYISKTLLHESIVEYGGSGLMGAVEAIFLISGGLTVAYMTKLFVAVFLEKNTDAAKQKQYDNEKHYMNKESGFALTFSALALLIWGLFPHSLMDRIAGLGESFMDFLHLAESTHKVAYFSLENLKGAFISIAIGAVVYLLIIRKCLMRKNAYVNFWPKWLDMEELIYRPLLLGFIPFICGVVCRIFDSFADLTVVLLRKTLYQDSPLPYERKEGNALTEWLGNRVNSLQTLRNRLWGRKHPTHKDFVHTIPAGIEDFRESFMIIQRSLSFGLLMFGIGLTLTLVYIILW